MCIFCKIINGEIPCYKVYEDNDFLAFLDLSQATKGHTLVVPKEHFKNIFDLSDELSSKMLYVVKQVSLLLKEKLNIDSVNLLNNSGQLAGQTVSHFHIHIIPRYQDDKINLSPAEHSVDKNTLVNTYNQIIK